MVWDTVAPIFPLMGLPLMRSRPFFLAFRHSHASNGLSSRNLRYRVTPAAENIPQYCATRVSITVHLNTGIILSCLIWTISPYTVVSTSPSLPMLAHASGSRREFDLTTLLRLEQSYAVKAATGLLTRHANTVSIHKGFSMSPGFLLRLFLMASLVS
jgi:hypothetical protein